MNVKAIPLYHYKALTQIPEMVYFVRPRRYAKIVPVKARLSWQSRFQLLKDSQCFLFVNSSF